MASKAKKHNTQQTNGVDAGADGTALPTGLQAKERGRGQVKAVPYGDALVVLSLDAPAAAGPPKERELSLSSLEVPRLGRPATKSQKATADQPWAWQAREFLRKKVIGKQVLFQVDFTVPNSSRQYATVFLSLAGQEPVNLNVEMVKAGWAKVKERPGNREPRAEELELIAAQEDAKAAKVGVWNEDEKAARASIRPLHQHINTFEVFNSCKGQALEALVDQVRSGGVLRLILLPAYYPLTVYLSGAQCPGFRKEGEEYVPEPFAREARFFTESAVLHRMVTVVLEGVDKSDNFYGTVTYAKRNVAEEVLKAGLGTYVDWSGTRSDASERLMAAEKAAQAQRLRLWASYNPATAASTATAVRSPAGGFAAAAAGGATATAPSHLANGAPSHSSNPGADGQRGAGPEEVPPTKEFSGKVMEVVNSGAIRVGDQRYLVTFSSIRVPRYTTPNPTKDTEAERVERAYAMAGKDFLRKLLIGKKVTVTLDYIRPAMPAKGSTPALPEKALYTVLLDRVNVAVALVEHGFAEVIEHRGGDNRSSDYETLMFAEKNARKKGTGLFGPAHKAPVFHVNDLSASTDKAKQMLPHLKQGGMHHAIVEHVFNGGRMKLHLPKQSCMMVFTFSGVRCVRGDTGDETLVQKTFAFLRDRLIQRDVEVTLDSCDKGGCFLGDLFLAKKNLATMLLDAGLAQVHHGSAAKGAHYAEFQAAEAAAKKAHRNMWKDWDEAAEQERKRQLAAEREEARNPRQELVSVVVTEVINGGTFYCQKVGEETSRLTEMMDRLSVEPLGEPIAAPAVGSLVRAKFSMDDAWYRGKVLSTGKAPNSFYILFVDYGNREEVDLACLRALPDSFRTIPFTAHEAVLAYVVAPSLIDDYGLEARDFLRELTSGKHLVANVEYEEGNKLFLMLEDPESLIRINAAMIRKGLCRVEKTRYRAAQPILAELKLEQEKAKKDRLCMWEYGDADSDDERGF